jgi:hypothetical protein
MDEHLPPAIHPLRDAGIRALAQHGPMGFDQLADALGMAPDSREFDDLAGALLSEDRVVDVGRDEIGDAVALLGGVVLTHELTAEEIAGGWLAWDIGLEPLGRIMAASAPLVTGGRLRLATGAGEGRPWARLEGPAGWLDGAAAGELLGLELRDGLVHVHRDCTADAPEPLVEAFASIGERRLVEEDPDAPAMVVEVLWEALAEVRPGRCVLPPLGRLVADAGFGLRGETLCPPGQGGDTPFADVLEDLVTAERFELADDGLRAYRRLREARSAIATGQEPGDLPELAVAMADPDVVEAFTDRGVDPHAAAVASAVLEAQTSGGVTLTPAAEAGARYMLALAAEQAGDHAAAETELHAAVQADPGHPLAAGDLAWFAEDRGDIRRALDLWRRAGHDDCEHTDRLLHHLAQRPRGVGRNDPCPCGSGRKFKVCCARREGGSLPDRAPWLADKLAAFATREATIGRLREVAEALVGDLDVGWKSIAMFDPLALDLGLFDLGLLEDFLDRRGHLLPDDERELAASWRDTRRAAYRVVRSVPGQVWLEPRDGGDVVSARLAPDVEEPPADVVVVCRLLPSGGSEPLVFRGGTAIGTAPRPDLEALVAGEADPLELARAFAAGTRLTNMEGEPTVFCEAHYRLGGDADSALAALRGLDLVEDGPGEFTQLIEIDGMDRVRGQVKVADGELGIVANSEARMDRLRRLVEDAVSPLELVADRRTPAGQAMEDARRFTIPAERAELSAEERAFIATSLGERERRDFAVPRQSGEWLDVELEWLDPADEDERRLLIEAEHPEFADAFEHDLDEVMVGGEAVNPHMHVAMHDLIAAQLWDDDPPEVWATAQRLVGLGYERHEVLHMLASVASEETWRMLDAQEPFDADRYRAGLDALPESWEALRDDGERGPDGRRVTGPRGGGSRGRGARRQPPGAPRH